MGNTILEITKAHKLGECELLTLLGKALDLAVDHSVINKKDADAIAMLITKKHC